MPKKTKQSQFSQHPLNQQLIYFNEGLIKSIYMNKIHGKKKKNKGSEFNQIIPYLNRNITNQFQDDSLFIPQYQKLYQPIFQQYNPHKNSSNPDRIFVQSHEIYQQDEDYLPNPQSSIKFKNDEPQMPIFLDDGPRFQIVTKISDSIAFSNSYKDPYTHERYLEKRKKQQAQNSFSKLPNIHQNSKQESNQHKTPQEYKQQSANNLKPFKRDIFQIINNDQHKSTAQTQKKNIQINQQRNNDLESPKSLKYIKQLQFQSDHKPSIIAEPQKQEELSAYGMNILIDKPPQHNVQSEKANRNALNSKERKDSVNNANALLKADDKKDQSIPRVKKQSSQNFYTTDYNTKSELKQKKERDQQLENFLQVKNNQLKSIKDQINVKQKREIMRTFLKRHGYEGEDKIVFILNSRDTFIKRAALKRGWFENPVPSSQFFDLKWDYIDNQIEYNQLQSNQYYNHFPDGREITTKQGLNKNLHNITECGVDIYQFYPRCYDLSDVRQIDQFIEEFERTAILNVIKQHAKHFKSIMKGEIEGIIHEDQQIINNIFKYENKKRLKRKYHNRYAKDGQQEQLGLINTVLLTNAIFYAKNILNDINESCEGDEFIKKNFYVARYEFSKKIKDMLTLYSSMKLPIKEFTEQEQEIKRFIGWECPSLYLMFLTLKIHRQLKKSIFQYNNIDDIYNVWICKPSYNARGFGIFCFNQLKDLFNGASKRNPAPKMVQKYIEKSLLLEGLNPQNPNDLRKFDIRQWVFVSSFDPLKVYVYKKAYLRICGSSFDLNDIQDAYKHISNYSIQKNQQQAPVQDLVMSSDEFIEYLKKQDPTKYSNVSWDHFYQQICSIVKSLLTQISENSDPRPNSFELFGFDFVIDKKLNCWLIEANMSPACAERAPWISEMLDDMAEGLLNIVEKRILSGSKFNGTLGTKAEDYQNHKIKTEIYQWDKIISNKSKKQNFMISNKTSPAKIGKGSTAISGQNFFGSAKGNQQFEVVGGKANIKTEKRIDKAFKQNVAALFIQKIWRSYRIRKQLYLEQLTKAINRQKKKEAVNSLTEILSLIFERCQPEDILRYGFNEIKGHIKYKQLVNDQDNINKLIKLQRYMKSRYQFLSPAKNDSSIMLLYEQRNQRIANQEFRQDQLSHQLYNSKVIKGLDKQSNGKSSRQALDKDLLLDYSVIGIHQNQTEYLTINQSKIKNVSKSSPKASPYLVSMKFQQFSLKKKSVKTSQRKNNKDMVVQKDFNLNLLKTQRELLPANIQEDSSEEQSNLSTLRENTNEQQYTNNEITIL